MRTTTLIVTLALGLVAFVGLAPAAQATHACADGIPCTHGEEVGAVLCLVAQPLPPKYRNILCSWVSG